jgi:hypothetical protein
MSDRESVGVIHPYDPLGPDGKPVLSLSYRNVLKSGSGSGSVYKKERLRTHFVKRVSPDDYPLNTSYLWNVDINKVMD